MKDARNYSLRPMYVNGKLPKLYYKEWKVLPPALRSSASAWELGFFPDLMNTLVPPTQSSRATIYGKLRKGIRGHYEKFHPDMVSY